MTNLDGVFKSRVIILSTKVRLVKAMVFPVVGHVWLWELDYKESLVPKNLCFRTVVLEKTLESLLDSKEILKESSPAYSFEGLMLKLKLQYFAHLMQRTDSSEDPAAGKDWRREEKGMTEDEMAGWLHRLNGHESE